MQAYDPELFFARQMINNACATQAILSVLLNRAGEIELGDEVSNLQAFSMGLPADEKGHCIGNSEKIRVAHNSFTRQDPFVLEDVSKPAGKDDEVYHFISFVPHKNRLYELDGLQAGPICFGECTEETWLAQAKEQIQLRIQKYASSEIRFNLLAIVGDKIANFEKDLTKQQKLEEWITKKRAGELSEAIASGAELGEYAAATAEIKNLAGLELEGLAAYAD